MTETHARPLRRGARTGHVGPRRSLYRAVSPTLRRRRGALAFAAVAVAYVAAAKFGIHLSVAHGVITPVWAPSGISLAALLILGSRYWPAIGLGAFVANATSGAALAVAAGIAVGNTLEAVAGAALVRRLGFHIALDRARDVVVLITGGAIVSTTISATNGVTILTLAGHTQEPYGSAWLLWWFGDAVGDVMVAPLLLVLVRSRRLRPTPARLIEGVGLVVAVTASSAVIFLLGAWHYPYVIFPLLLWSVFRFRQLGAAVTSFILGAIGTWGTVAGTLPIGAANPTERVQLFQALFVGVAASLLIVGAALAERDAGNEALRQTAELLSEAQALTHIGGWEWHITNDDVVWSDELYRIFGLSADEFVPTYEGFLERVDPRDRNLVRETIAGAMRSREPFGFDHRIVRPDGEVRTLHAEGRVLVDEANTAFRMAGTGQDITERTRAEEALRHSEELHRSIIETAGDAFVAIDALGSIIDWNRAAELTFGWRRDEAIGLSLADTIIHPRDREAHRRGLRRFLATGEGPLLGRRLELTALRRDGGEVPVELTVWPLREGETWRFNAFLHDISERKQAHKKLQASEERFRELLDSAPDAMVIVSGDGRIALVNRQTEHIFGYEREELLHRPVEVLVPQSLPTKHNGRLRRYVTDPRVRPVSAGRELYGRRKDGTTFPVEVSLSPLRTEGGTLLSAAIRDISDRKADERELARLYERERGVAETLQRSLLPERLPDLAGVEVTARYLPAGGGLEVGGDWYDVISLGGGRLGLAIGDVVGRGIPAASLMGQIRNALRAYAIEDSRPAAIVNRLNRLIRQLAPEQTATVLFATFDAATTTLRFATAGHPPPLLLTPAGTTKYLEGGRSTPLGAPPARHGSDRTVVLEAGSTLLFYTDGLVEERGASLAQGLATLEKIVAGGPTELDALCDNVLRNLISRAPPGDDVALLALRPQPTPAGSELAITLPADPAVLAPLRDTLERWLGNIDAEPRDAFAITLACCEACANVIEHAYGPGPASFEVEAAAQSGSVAVTVRDFGKWRKPRGRDRGRGLHLMKAFMDNVEVTPSPRGTEVRLRRLLHQSEER